MGPRKEKVTRKNFESLLLKSVDEALDHMKGKKTLPSRRVRLIPEPPTFSKTQIKRIRKQLGVSQSTFAQIFGESTSAVQHWEQGTRNMSKSARRVLGLIEKDADLILEMIC